MNAMNEKIRAFVLACLEDEHGISEKAYEILLDMREMVGWPASRSRFPVIAMNDELAKEINAIVQRVYATDGCFYIPKD